MSPFAAKENNSAIQKPEELNVFAPQPATLPADFETRCDLAAGRLLEKVEVDLIGEEATSALERTFLAVEGIELSNVLASLFCASLFRITGNADGTILFTQGVSNPAHVLSFDIQPEYKPMDLILAQLRDGVTSIGVDGHSIPISLVVVDHLKTAASPATTHNNCFIEWTLSISRDHGIRSRTVFDSTVISSESIQSYASVYQRMLESCIENPFHSLFTIELCTPKDFLDFRLWNETFKTGFSVDSVGALFRKVAEKYPLHIAVTSGTEGALTLTYEQLDLWSDGLALWLIENGFGGNEETIVGVWQSRGVMVVVSYLACLKAGCAYMPMDMSLPAERLKIMLQISKSPLVLVAGTAGFPDSSVRTLDLKSSRCSDIFSRRESSKCKLPSVTPERLAFIIFTSGSTGVPKAVMVQHSQLLNFLLLEMNGLDHQARMPMVLSIAFDVSSGEIWLPLARGATLVCYERPAGSFDIADMANFLETEKITVIVLPGALVRALSEAGFFYRELPDRFTVAIGGETLLLETVTQIKKAKPNISIVNCYGPSESVIIATQFLVPPDYNGSLIPIGRPLPNIRAYVVDDHMNFVPPGVQGELFLTGSSVARGYLNQPQLTDERFVTLNGEHPLGPVRGYRTGDIVRQLPTGEFVYLKRRDDGQVKLRGYRIELGEIEQALHNHPQVLSAVVVLCKRKQESLSQLVAYLTCEDATSDAVALALDVKSFLKGRLPPYMLPAYILRVPSFALTVTGKVDRKTMATSKYADLVIADVYRGCIAPRVDAADLKPLQLAVRDVFADALGMDKESLGVLDNFFDIGGHSLIAVRIVTAIRRLFDVALTMHFFMDHATVSEVAAFVESSQPGRERANSRVVVPRRVASEDSLFPASDVQVGLWVEEQLNPGLSTYNTGFQLRLTGRLSVEALRSAFVSLVKRHEALRTTFEIHGDTLMQRIQPCSAIAARFQMRDVQDESFARGCLSTEASRIFDLSLEMPIRLYVFHVNKDLHFVSLVIHHIVTDGWSSGIIDRELTSLYNKYIEHPKLPPVLAPLPVRYGDVAVWYKTFSQSGIFGPQIKYWSDKLKGAKPLELFTDYARPKSMSGNAAEIRFDIEPETVSLLRQLAAEHRTSLYVILLTAFRSVVYRLNGEEDGMLGMVSANRPAPELEGIVGFFVNTHALRLPVDSNSTFKDVIKTTRSTVADALQHSDVPYHQLVAELAPERNIARKALAQLELVLQDFAGVSENTFGQGFHGLTSEDIRMPSTNLDLAIHLFSQDSSLRGFLMYQSDLFSPDTAKSVLNVFQRVVNDLSKNPSANISSLDLISPRDLDCLSQWNNSQSSEQLPVTLMSGFADTVEAHGSAVALVDGPAFSLTYTELSKWSDRLASFLIGKGFCRESIVGVYSGRSWVLVVSYLACLKAGLVFMPVDKGLPLSRIRLMLQTANCKMLITAGECALDGEIECLNLPASLDICLSTPIVTFPQISAENACCVVFTSGSTGVPKGVVVEHRGMVNLCAPQTTHWPGRLRNGVTSGVGFDPSIYQIFTSLLTAAPLYCLPDNGVFDPRAFIQFLLDFGIQRINITPSVLNSLLAADDDDWLERSSLEHLLLGGEAVIPSKVLELHMRKPGLKIYAVYGPTEASVTSTYYDIPPTFYEKPLRRMPLGRALTNTTVYVVDKSLNPVPALVMGEIAVSGPHLARGYLNQPDLTESRFVQIPSTSSLAGKRVYLTGDLGYWTPDGTLHFVSRIDTQVKVRGQRIETSEVELALEAHPYVKTACVVVVKDEVRDMLVGYVRLNDAARTEAELLDMWSQEYNEEALVEEFTENAEVHDAVQWESMMDGKLIPQVEMDDWLVDTTSRIAARPEDRVLEIGIGTGQIALKLAEHVTFYAGVDISHPSLDWLKHQLEERGLSSKTSLRFGAAHEVDTFFGDSKQSLVVINSVAQYFPSGEYLAAVIKAQVKAMKFGGRIFIGDIRSYGLIQHHDTQRVLGSLPPDTPINDIRRSLERFATTQTELLINPSFFYDLQRRFPDISHVEILPKLMPARNELSRYRYGAILHVGASPEVITPADWIDCSQSMTPLEEIRGLLLRSKEDVLGVTRVRIEDLERIRDVRKLIDAPETEENVEGLRRKLAESLDQAQVASPATLEKIALAEGWVAFFDYSAQSFDSVDNYIQVVFARRSCLPHQRYVGGFKVPAIETPLFNTIVGPPRDKSQVKASITDSLRESLPKYMVPYIVDIAEYPLTASGKLDLKLLASPKFFDGHDKDDEAGEHIEQPATSTERAVLAIFSNVLKRSEDKIDVCESFFTLGGHSLMATMVVSQIRRELGAELSMVTFFLGPSVREVSKSIESTAHKTQIIDDLDDVAVLAKTTITANVDAKTPILFLFPESTGFASAYSSAFPNVSHQIVAFGDSRWGERLSNEESISSVAAEGVTQILAHQAEGPYYIGGWSLGGHVALEAARQLTAAGKHVSIVMLFDAKLNSRTLEPEGWSSELDPLLTILDDKEQWLSQLNRANSLVSRFSPKKGRYTGKVVLIKATRESQSLESDAKASDPHNGWLGVLPQIVVHPFDASHREMFDHKNGPKTGTLITKILDEHENGLSN